MYVSVEFGFLLKIGKHKACSKPVLETLHEKSRLMSANPSLGFCDSTSWIPHSCSMVGGFNTDTSLIHSLLVTMKWTTWRTLCLVVQKRDKYQVLVV